MKWLYFIIGGVTITLILGLVSGQASPLPESEPVAPPSLPTPPATLAPFCGMQFVSNPADYPTMTDLGVTILLTTFPHDGTPADWQAHLDQLQAHNLQALAVQWPQGWRWQDGAWQIDEQATLFLQTVADHPATFAVFGLQEPYWRGCRECGLTTAQQQQLYRHLKAIADVPLYFEIGDVAFWANEGAETTLRDGVCDYCGVWFYPAWADGSYQRQPFIDHVDGNIRAMRHHAPHSKLVWLLQVFAQEDYRRMPTDAEIQDMGAIVAARDVDGIFWYVWQFGPLYSDFLANHPELFPAVQQMPFCRPNTNFMGDKAYE